MSRRSCRDFDDHAAAPGPPLRLRKAARGRGRPEQRVGHTAIARAAKVTEEALSINCCNEPCRLNYRSPLTRAGSQVQSLSRLLFLFGGSAPRPRAMPTIA